METLRPRHFIPLKYITDILTAKDNGAASHMYRADEVLLLLTSDGRAISLGSGRYASVVLGADRANYEQANTTFLAIKFLKRDVDSDVASKIARTRFYEEIEKTRKITTRNIDLEGGFVAYKGFSSYKSLTSEQYDTEAAETLKSTFGEEMIRSIVRENETRKDEIEKAVAFTLQGEFYVMQAESGTLDDILIYRQPWEARGLEGVRKSLASEGSSDLLGRFRIERHDALMELVRDLKLEAFAKKGQDFSGFAILKEIGMQRPKERNRMVVELFQKITHSIQTVHRAKLHEQEGFLAHRDIKPGNFLVRCGFPELKLLISDLGFVSGSKAENLGAETMQVSVREPGVLAPGSYMFRAPEQMEQGYEINFQVEPDTHSDTGPASSKKIAFDNIGDKNIEPGDWFETDAVAATDGTPPPFKSYIDSVDHERGRVLVTLKDRFDYSGAYPVFHGHITRLSALHSDLFSLGCILYFLISGGKNPEKFYVRCLEASRFERQNSGHAQTQKRKEDDLYENCMRISATLCAERGKNIIREIGCIHLDKMKCDNRLVYSNEEIEFVKQVVRERNILSIPGIGKLHGLRNYRQHLQSTSSVAYYVSDTNERPIPFAILYEIVRLLVRDKEDSYVTRIKPGNQARAPSYFDLVLHEKTQEIEDRVSKVLDMSMCCKKEIRDHAIFGDTRAEYFVMLRCCLGPELLNGNGVPPAGGRNRSGAAKNQGSVCINGGRTKGGDYNRQARAKSVLRNRISPVTQAWRTMETVMKRWAHIGWHQYMFSSKSTDSIYRLILSTAAVAVAGVVSVILYSKWTENDYKPFKECEVCPEMVALPGGTFTMGSPRDEGYRQATEEPQRQVTIKPFAIGKHEVTFAEWDACVTAGGCNGYKPPDEAWGRGSRPVVNASWQNAQDYVSWLAKQTDKTYRLPTEAEWEYAARAGTMTPFSFGETISTAQANYNGSGQKGENRKQTVPVGSLPANPWGLHEVHGNVWEWVEDCWHGSYQDAPQDGRAWVEDLCTNRVARGGSWDSNQKDIRSAARAWMPDKRHSTMGFRVARALTS